VAGRVGFVALAVVTVVAALSTGSQPLYFLVYLAGLTLLLAYLAARRGLAGLEAGSWLDRRHATVGDALTITYTIRNPGRLPRPWLEVGSPTTLPLAVPGRAIGLWPRSSRTWAVRVPLVRRGQFRVDPMVVRTGDPLGLFESVASVGAGAGVLVYPQVEPLDGWRLPPAPIEGSTVHAERTQQVTPLVTTVRPYVPGDSYSRIHWRSTARQQEIQVKEFDIERTADVWIFLDLDRTAHTGDGDEATVETAVRACASIAAYAIDDHRAVGLEVVGLRRTVQPLDRGPRQFHKIMALLAVVQADGSAPLAEMLVDGLRRPRRGCVVIIVTPSLDQGWVRQVAGLRNRGMSALVCLLDPLAHVDAAAGRRGGPLLAPEERDTLARDLRAMRHALAEHDVPHTLLGPGRPLVAQLQSAVTGRMA
jgi:uncharacterized protein (DUF58 family)